MRIFKSSWLIITYKILTDKMYRSGSDIYSNIYSLTSPMTVSTTRGCG